MKALEMKCWRSLIGVSRMNRVRHEEVRRRAGIFFFLKRVNFINDNEIPKAHTVARS